MARDRDAKEAAEKATRIKRIRTVSSSRRPTSSSESKPSTSAPPLPPTRCELQRRSGPRSRQNRVSISGPPAFASANLRMSSA